MPVSLATKVSSGNLERSYRRAPKGAKEEDHGVAGAGICHLCLCGQGIDWEDLLLTFALYMLTGFVLRNIYFLKSVYLQYMLISVEPHPTQQENCTW